MVRTCSCACVSFDCATPCNLCFTRLYRMQELIFTNILLLLYASLRSASALRVSFDVRQRCQVSWQCLVQPKQRCDRLQRSVDTIHRTLPCLQVHYSSRRPALLRHSHIQRSRTRASHHAASCTHSRTTALSHMSNRRLAHVVVVVGPRVLVRCYA